MRSTNNAAEKNAPSGHARDDSQIHTHFFFSLRNKRSRGIYVEAMNPCICFFVFFVPTPTASPTDLSAGCTAVYDAYQAHRFGLSFALGARETATKWMGRREPYRNLIADDNFTRAYHEWKGQWN